MTLFGRKLSVSLLVALVIIPLVIAQTRKPRTEVVAIPAGPHKIEVNTTAHCTKTKSEAGIPGDTVQWAIKSGTNITNFHIIFPQSPFTNGQTYFEKNNSGPVTIAPLAAGEDSADFEYVIAVDGYSTCDPHVIVIKGGSD